MISVQRAACTAALIVFTVALPAAVLFARGGRVRRHSVPLELRRRLGRLLLGAAVPLAVQGIYVIGLRFAAGTGTGNVTSLSYAYLLAAMFVSGGIDAVRNPDRLVPSTKPLVDQWGSALDSVGLPTDPKTLVQLNGAAQIAGGVMLGTGMAPRLGALTLAGSLVPTTFAGHPFWQEEDPDRRKQQRIHFFKNVSMLGGALLIAYYGAGPISVDAARKRG